MMNEIIPIRLVQTADGSKTIYHEKVGEHYHSRHGAVGESRHVFVGMGLEFVLQRMRDQSMASVRILEVGFGTGLNFLTSVAFLDQWRVDDTFHLDYVGVEAFPLTVSVLDELGYEGVVGEELWNAFLSAYPASLKQKTPLKANMRLQILTQKIMETRWDRDFDLIYFDAFSATHQPEMWTMEVLEHVTRNLVKGGVFVTYSITGDLKRSLKSLGFTIEKLPGAPGKREMLRAIKEG